MPTLIQRLQFFIEMQAKGFSTTANDVIKNMKKIGDNAKGPSKEGISKLVTELNRFQEVVDKSTKELLQNNISVKQWQNRIKDGERALKTAVPAIDEYGKEIKQVTNALNKQVKAQEKVILAEKLEKNALKASRSALTKKVNVITKVIEKQKLEGQSLKQFNKIMREIQIRRDIINEKEKVGNLTRRAATAATKKLTGSLIELQIRGLKGSKKALERHLLGLKQSTAATIRMGGSTIGLMRTLSRWRNRLLVLTFALAGMVRGIQRFIQAAIEAEKQTIALNIIAIKTGNSVASITKAAIDLSKDGVLSFVGAAQAIKNLISTGASIDVVVKNLQAMKDAALANGLASISAEEAIIRYTQGVKENKSQLTDTAGIMTNISVLLKRAASNTSDLSLADKLLIEFTKEANLFSGTLAKSLETLGGQLQIAKTASKSLAIELGNKLIPLAKILLARYLAVIESVKEWASDTENLKKIMKETETILVAFLKIIESLVSLLGKLSFVFNLTFGAVDRFDMGVRKSLKSMREWFDSFEFINRNVNKDFGFGFKEEDVQTVKDMKKELDEIIPTLDAVTNVIETQRLVTMMEQITKEVIKRENATEGLRASIMELNGDIREAFVLRQQLIVDEKRAEIELIQIKLRNAQKLRDVLVKENIKELERLTPILAFMKQTGDELSKVREGINKLKKANNSANESVKNLKEIFATLGVELGLTETHMELLLQKFDDDRPNKFADSMNKITEAFARFNEKVATDVSRQAAKPLGFITSFGAPRAQAAGARQEALNEIRLRQLKIVQNKRLKIIEELLNKRLIIETEAEKLRLRVKAEFQNSEQLQQEAHQRAMKQIDEEALRERIKLAADAAKKILDLTLFASMRDRTQAKIQRAIADEQLKIDLDNRIIDQKEFAEKTQILNRQGELQEKAAAKRRNADIRIAIADELTARAVLWAIQGPIELFSGNIAKGSAMIAGAIAAGVAVASLLGSAGALQAQAAVLDTRATGLGQGTTGAGDFEGQGRVITGSFSTPLGGVSVNPTVIINADVVGIGAGGIEETESALEELMIEVTQRAVDSGQLAAA